VTVFEVNGTEYRVSYLPAESDTGMFGGNSNWRGPIWMRERSDHPRAAAVLPDDDDFKIECPTGSGGLMNLFEVSQEIAERLARIFLRDDTGRRAVFGGAEKFQNDPHWRDYILFYEYFHGDSGAGLGASHQTGWTGMIARLIQLFGSSWRAAAPACGGKGVRGAPGSPEVRQARKRSARSGSYPRPSPRARHRGS
jgi:hypothetical protein